jgi:hypothetical protein
MGPISRVIDPGVEAFVVRGADGGVISSGYGVLVNVGEGHSMLRFVLACTLRRGPLTWGFKE